MLTSECLSPVKKEYDFCKSRKNPYPKQLKSQVTIRLDTSAVEYFKKMGAELGMPYRNLINLILRDCAMQKRRPTIQWPELYSRSSAARSPSSTALRISDGRAPIFLVSFARSRVVT